MKTSINLYQHPLLISVLFAITGLTVVGQIYLPIPIFLEISRQFNISQSLAGWVSSAFSIGYSAGFLLSGPLSDRFGRKRIMLAGFIFFIGLTVLVGLSKTFGQLLLFRSLQGLAASSYPPIILAYLNEKLSPPSKGRAISFMSLGFLTASIISQLYSIELQNIGVGIIEYTLIPIYCASLILIFYVIEDKNNTENNKNTLLDIYRKIPELLLDKNLRWLYSSTLCTLSALVAFYILLDENYGLRFASVHISPLMTRLIALPAMFLSLLAPLITSRIGSIALVKWSFTIASIGLLLSSVSVLYGDEWDLLYTSIIFIGGRAFSVPSLVGAIGDIADKLYKGTAISLYTFILFLGASLGPLLAHVLMYFSYSYSLIILAFLAGLPAVLTMFIQDSKSIYSH